MLAELRKIRYPVEFGLLVILCFFLPLYEAPKNLAWLGFVLAWLVNRLRAREFGGPWDLWDSLIALWIASGYVVAAFAGLDGSEWRGAGDLLRYGSILWLVKRGGYSAREIRWLLGTLIASTVVGLAHGYWRWWSGIGKSGTLQLHSVGHVNHTAIYLAIMLGVCASWLFTCWQAWRWWVRALALGVSLFVLASLVVTASRAALAAGLMTLLLFGVAWRPRWKPALVGSAAAVAIVVAASFAMGLYVVRKYDENVEKNELLSVRDSIWRTGVAAWERFPLFGVGMDNYGLITRDRIKSWQADARTGYDEGRYVEVAHAHSLYVNTLAERGIVGLGVLFAVLLAWLSYLVRLRPRPRDDDLDLVLWGSATAAWLVTVAAGTLNTTLHHEHGILAVLLLGAWLSRRAQLSAS